MPARAPRLRKKPHVPAEGQVQRPVPPFLFGKDHWSTLGYVETRCVDHGGRLEKDHMRTNRMRHPLLVSHRSAFLIPAGTQYPTRLAGAAAVLRNHDDWDCLEDLEAAGLITIDLRTYPQGCLAVPPGARGKISGDIHRTWKPMVALTELGAQVAGLLRAHKAAGGSFGDFVWTPPETKK